MLSVSYREVGKADKDPSVEHHIEKVLPPRTEDLQVKEKP